MENHEIDQKQPSHYLYCVAEESTKKTITSKTTLMLATHFTDSDCMLSEYTIT